MDNPKEKTVTIPVSEYVELLNRGEVLSCLEAGGVDNWDWYEASLVAYIPVTEEEVTDNLENS